MSDLTGNMSSVADIPSCCEPRLVQTIDLAPTSHEETTKFHFALNVSDLNRSVEFYSVLFGTPPAKHHHDYAKFELTQPALVFSLVPNPPSSGGSLSHFGFPVNTTKDVDAAARRFTTAGLEITTQAGTVCGYARQDKVWVADPDRNFWEIYVVHEDVDPETVRSAFDGISPTIATSEHSVLSPPANSNVVWEHRVLMPLPDRIPYDDATVDEVRLEGSFNDSLSEVNRTHLLAEAKRVLRPAGTLSVHGLVSDGPLNELPTLPGVAALVKRVPQIHEPINEIAGAGFDSIYVTKLPQSPVFRAESIGLREIKLTARKSPSIQIDSASRTVVYKGPFATAEDDSGQTFQRGLRTAVTQQTYDRLAAGAAASQFVFLNESCGDVCGCG